MNEHSIFLAALEIADPNERTSYLDVACADDPTLRKQVDALFAAHERSGEFLDVPALKQMAGDSGDPNIGAETSIDTSACEGEIDLSFLEPSTAPGSLGRLKHYEVREVIGRGGCGIVLKAFDEKLERIVAIKIMAPELAATSPARKRFLREARHTAQIRHENVVSIYSVEEQPLPFLVMEFIDGETLQQRLDRTGPLDAQTVLRIGSQVAAGLAAAHDKGLIHRDIKPGNILLEDGTDHLKITDFGLARSADDASMTQSGVIAGTPLYMSPEQAQAHDIDQRSDLFSLGSVLYVMCSGRPPFRAASTLAVMKRVVEEQPRPIQAIIPEVPDWLSAMIAKLHAKEPGDRFGSAKEVGDLLARCLSELEQHGRVELPEDILAMLPQPESEEDEHAHGKRSTAEEVSIPSTASHSARFQGRRWATAAAIALVLLVGLGVTEATGVTNFGGTVIRLFSPAGTLVVEVDDPGVSVTVDGEEMVITGTGTKEIRLKPGEYKLLASKDGKLLSQELVTVTRNGRQVVRVSREVEPTAEKRRVATPDRRAAEWVLSVGGSVRGASDPGRLISAGDSLPPGEWKLTMASIAGNPRATDAELAVFENCRNLSAIYLSDTAVTDAGLVYFKDSKDLLSLILDHTAVTDKGLAIFKDHKRLEQISLIGTRVTDQGLLDLGKRKVHRLLLAETNVGDAGLAVFKDSQKLITLDLSGTRVTDAGLVHFRGCPRLQNVILDDTQVGDSAIANFEDCQELSGLMLHGTQVSDAGLEQITKLKSLDNVGLSRTNVTAAGVKKLAAARPDLRIAWDGGIIQPTSAPDPNGQATATQADAVREELRRRNPEFKGEITYLVEDGRVVHWSLVDGTLPDLSPLLELEHLKQLNYAAFNPERDAPVLRQLTSLEKINQDSAASYRLAYPANKPATGVSDEWLKAVSKLPVKSRGKLVIEKLQEQNPNFDGKYAFRDNDMYLNFDSRAVTDLSPLKALPELRTLVCSVPFPNHSWLSDLSPLSGTSLERLECERTRVADLSPLKGKLLTKLDLTSTPVSDLTPLKGMPITWFDLAFTRVENLAPLAGMPMTRLDLQAVPVADLSPLKGMPLEKLNIGWSNATDLSPLEGMPLHDLNIAATKVTDLSPLKQMPLVYLWIPGPWHTRTNLSAENLQILRGIESLKTINGKPTAEFWKLTDAP